MQNICILGATGTIGQNTLAVIAENPNQFRAYALFAYQDHAKLFAQCQQFQPKYAGLVLPEAAVKLREACRAAKLNTEIVCGAEAAAQLAILPEVDQVMAAIVGAAGLASTLAAARAGKRILLANKESLVMAGDWLMRTARNHHATILPIDSEHNAAFQCLTHDYVCGNAPKNIQKITLTASGGPFRTLDLTQFAHIKPEQAIKHPNWVMGRKISVDSASMMNKGLELIEAHYLFQLSADKLDAVLHPQSLIHALVTYDDGSVIAQLGTPDMRIPIAQGLAHPTRVPSGAPSLDLAKMGSLDFSEILPERYPAYFLARAALAAGGSAPLVLNAANEIAVQAFLDGDLGFLGISDLVERALNQFSGAKISDSIEGLFELDSLVRNFCEENI